MNVLSKISTSFLRNGLLCCGLLLFVLLFLKTGLVVALFWSVVPILFYFMSFLVRRPESALYLVFIANYLIMGLTRYIKIFPGITMDVFLLMTLMIIFLRTKDQRVNWSETKNSLILFNAIWLLYCVLLVFNPDTSFSDWSAGIRGLAGYMFIYPLFTLILLNKHRHFRTLLFIWSICTLLAVAKGIMQKYYGFDAAEKYWLFVKGGDSTHIISSGTRYFSFLNDAASFSFSMGLSMVVFGILALHVQKYHLKIYFLVITIAAFYGLMISGTRAAIAIPFAGFAFYIFLSRQWKIIIPGVLIIVCAFSFFRFTNIGHDIQEIRRIRSAFQPTKDASFIVRQNNQKKMAEFMQYKPFGIGVGKVKRSNPGDYMYDLPSDTSLVLVWVETGPIGLSIFLLIFLFILIKGSYDVWFKIKSNIIKGEIGALLAGITGVLVASYGNEALQIFPNGPIVYMLMAFIMLGVKYDKEFNPNEATI